MSWLRGKSRESQLMLEGVVVVHSPGGPELRYRGGARAGGGRLMRVGGNLVVDLGLGVSERDRTMSANWGQTNPILSSRRQTKNVCVQMLWLPELDVLAQTLGGELSGRNWRVTSPDWLFPVSYRIESWHGPQGGRENALG